MVFDDEDLRIIAKVKDALSASPAWDNMAFLRIRVEYCVPLDVAAKQSPEDSGLYALCLATGLCYDEAVSRIVYIGSTKNLHKRLQQHNRKPHNSTIELLRQKFSDDIRVAWWAIPSLNRKFLYGIEGEALRVFEQSFGVLPICNLDVPEFYEGQEYCRGLVKIIPCETTRPLALEELAQQLDRVILRRELEPSSGGIVIRLAVDPLDAPVTKFRMATLLTRQQAELEAQLHEVSEEPRDCANDEEYTEEMRLYELSLIHDVNIAAWSTNKMVEIIKLCKKLKPKSTKAKKMKPFEAPFREVPVPHTWGEVAIVQARIVGGSWQPGKQIWVKVLHVNDLLSEAKLNLGWYFGEDKSDLPQRATERAVRQKQELNSEPIELVEETEDIYGLEITTWRSSEITTEKQIREKLQQEKEALWRTVEDLFQQALSRVDC